MSDSTSILVFARSLQNSRHYNFQFGRLAKKYDNVNGKYRLCICISIRKVLGICRVCKRLPFWTAMYGFQRLYSLLFFICFLQLSEQVYYYYYVTSIPCNDGTFPLLSFQILLVETYGIILVHYFWTKSREYQTSRSSHMNPAAQIYHFRTSDVNSIWHVYFLALSLSPNFSVFPSSKDTLSLQSFPSFSFWIHGRGRKNSHRTHAGRGHHRPMERTMQKMWKGRPAERQNPLRSTELDPSHQNL